jgi:hypothetical protein
MVRLRVTSARRAFFEGFSLTEKNVFSSRAFSFTLEHPSDASRERVEREAMMTKWGEGLRATRSRGGRVWFPPGRERAVASPR